MKFSMHMNLDRACSNLLWIFLKFQISFFELIACILLVIRISWNQSFYFIVNFDNLYSFVMFMRRCFSVISSIWSSWFYSTVNLVYVFVLFWE